jgi:hypothetical protein
MKVIFKLTRSLAVNIQEDLRRSHPYAGERMGFISCKAGRTTDGLVLLAGQYHALDDARYLPGYAVGAMMDSMAIRNAMQYSFAFAVSMFHVHLHDHRGRPRFSGVDLRETRNFVPDFFNVTPAKPHGAVILSADSARGFCWLPETRRPVGIDQFVFVGTPMVKVQGR